MAVVLMNCMQLGLAELSSVTLFSYSGMQAKGVTTIWNILFEWWRDGARDTEPYCARTFCSIPLTKTSDCGQGQSRWERKLLTYLKWEGELTVRTKGQK